MDFWSFDASCEFLSCREPGCDGTGDEMKLRSRPPEKQAYPNKCRKESKMNQGWTSSVTEASSSPNMRPHKGMN
jgi:hypothetical protein